MEDPSRRLLDSLLEELIKIMECPVCLQKLTSPIGQCRVGHSICIDCMKNTGRCPTCRAEFSESRNFLAEDIAIRLLYPCPNFVVGCPIKVTRDELENHERSCSYRLHHCLMTNCDWIGRSIALLNHFENEHPQCVCKHRSKKLIWPDVSFDKPCSAIRLISVFGELFWCIKISEPEKQSVFFYVQYIGEESKASQFLYEFELKSSDTRYALRYCSATVSDLREMDSIIESKECFDLNHNMAKHFINEENKIVLGLTISQKV